MRIMNLGGCACRNVYLFSYMKYCVLVYAVDHILRVSL